MQIKTRSRVVVFILSFLVYAALTSIRDRQEVIAGLIAAFLVTSIAGHFLLTTEKKRHFFYRCISMIRYLFLFLWEMIKANVHVAYLVIHPSLPIHPGIVKIKTTLTKDSALTVLANSITLTPGTLSVDVNPDKKELYIHWIDVVSTDVKETSRLIGGKFEKVLSEVYE